MIGFTFSWLEFWPKKNEGKRGGIRMEESIYNVTLRKHLKYLSSDLLLTQVHTKSQNGWCCRSREIGSWLRQTSSRRQLQIAVEEVPDPWSPRQDKGPEDFFRLDSARCRPIWYSFSPPPPPPLPRLSFLVILIGAPSASFDSDFKSTNVAWGTRTRWVSLAFNLISMSSHEMD